MGAYTRDDFADVKAIYFFHFTSLFLFNLAGFFVSRCKLRFRFYKKTVFIWYEQVYYGVCVWISSTSISVVKGNICIKNVVWFIINCIYLYDIHTIIYYMYRYIYILYILYLNFYLVC